MTEGIPNTVRIGSTCGRVALSKISIEAEFYFCYRRSGMFTAALAVLIFLSYSAAQTSDEAPLHGMAYELVQSKDDQFDWIYTPLTEYGEILYVRSTDGYANGHARLESAVFNAGPGRKLCVDFSYWIRTANRYPLTVFTRHSSGRVRSDRAVWANCDRPESELMRTRIDIDASKDLQIVFDATFGGVTEENYHVAIANVSIALDGC